MRTIVIGTPDDSLGFALTGTTTFLGNDSASVDRAITNALKNVADPILIFSHDAAELARDRIESWAQGTSGPLFAVLPE